jgi:uncharacterized protein YkwD
MPPRSPAHGGKRVNLHHGRDRDARREPIDLSVVQIIRLDRRKILSLLAALPAALRLAVFAERDAAEARKSDDKTKKDGHKKGHDKGGKAVHYAPDKEERAFLDLINDYRRKNGAGALSLENHLGAAAEHHSKDMAKKNYFSHKLSNGDSPEKNIERFGYTHWTFMGENIAAGFETADKVFDAWKHSKEHDKNMRNKDFKDIGIGRAFDKHSKYGWYWTTTFGAR